MNENEQKTLKDNRLRNIVPGRMVIWSREITRAYGAGFVKDLGRMTLDQAIGLAIRYRGKLVVR